MKTFALCTVRTRAAVAKATGGVYRTCPPMVSAEELKPYQGYDLWYIRLHGREDHPDLLYGEQIKGLWTLALGIEDIEDLDLTGVTIISGSCFGLDSNWGPAFLAAGAEEYIAGHGPNFGTVSKRVVGTDLLVSWFLRGKEKGLSTRGALGLAKSRLALTSWRGSDRDALKFERMKGELKCKNEL